MPRPIVHMIGNAHIDPVWLWCVDEGREEVLSTYRSAIDRMRETASFVFTSGGAATYRWVAEDDPDLLAAIRQRVAEGRWSLVNGWWVQPDCNIPCGESFARHGLYGQRALEALFGRRAVTGYNVDSFGHTGSLPQILFESGLCNYVFFRPAPGIEKDLPGTLFWWESDDGTRVLASRPPLHYPSEPGALVERIDLAAAQAPPAVGHVMCFYGVGNHGGGPTRANIASILGAMERVEGPEVRFGSPDRFFEAVRASGAALPVLHDELQHHARGCYTAVSRCKWYNRKCETALLTAEKFAALAHRFLGVAYPHASLTHAWENVLFNQFHDILAGTSLHEAYEDAYESYKESLGIADLALETALSAMAAQIDTRGAPGSRPLLVFNPLPWAQRVPVETAVPVTASWHDDWRGTFRPGAIELLDDRGQAVPCQVTALEHSGGQYLIRFCFLADLPALGYRCYALTIPDDAPVWDPSPPAQGAAIENAYLRLTLDPDTGWVTSLYDLERGLELMGGPGGVPRVIDDPSDTWSHDVERFDDVIGAFEAAGRVVVVERGPVRQTVRADCTWGDSRVVLEYSLYAGERQVRVTVSVDWREQLKMLKLAFPFGIADPHSTAAIPYGRIQRVDDGGEEPCQEWVDLSGGIGGERYGVALLNDSKYGYDCADGELRMSLVRSPVYAFHTPRQIERGVTYEYVDQGEQAIHMALLPHAGSYVEGDVVRCAASLNAPPVVAEVEAHPGAWAPAASLASCEAPNIVLTALKVAEEGDDLIVRGYETAGRETMAQVRIGADGPRWTVAWRPHEIVTLRVSGDGAPVRVNILEEPAP
ncbi:MAG: alpha-mannosidase [Anaerolineae bacterium]|nr:alpha-mannosidase [Anaerolineae bacterium]